MQIFSNTGMYSNIDYFSLRVDAFMLLEIKQF